MKEKLSNNTILKKISRLNLKPNGILVAYTILAERDENSLECIIGQKRIASSTNTSQQQTAKIINTLKNMHLELSEIFGKEVDLVEKSAVEKSRNYLRRKAILGTAEVLYAS